MNAITLTNSTSSKLMELNSCGSISQTFAYGYRKGVNNLNCFDLYGVTQQKF